MTTSHPSSVMTSGLGLDGLEFDQRVFELQVKAQLANDLKALPNLSRDQVCEQLSEIVGVQVSVTTLENMIAPSKVHRFPMTWVPAWFDVTSSIAVLKKVARACGLHVITHQDFLLLQVAKKDEAAAAARAALRSFRRGDLMFKNEGEQ